MAFSFFAGALADIYGCKRFILLPVIGMLISDIGILINYAFISQLPIEFFYIEPIYSFFGGKAVYYLGKYIFCSLLIFKGILKAKTLYFFILAKNASINKGFLPPEGNFL